MTRPSQAQLLQATSGNSSFSSITPGLQLAVDSTSLGVFKECPRKYFYSLILGYQSKGLSVHLDFGIWFHGAAEFYDRAKADGADHYQALSLALKWALAQTWNKTLGRGWVSDHPVKHRMSLIRGICWYLDNYADDESMETVQLANGKPAVELSFRFELGHYSNEGESFVACGHLDKIVNFAGGTYIKDIKTTSGGLGPRFFGGFSPDNQMSFYDVAGQVVYESPVNGIIIDGVQIGSGFARFERALVPRSDALRAEWLDGLGFWLYQLEHAALTQNWPMNEKSCSGPYGECVFRGICSKPPGARPQWLAQGFVIRQWDPLQVRGPH
jgi:hypothetical protein